MNRTTPPKSKDRDMLALRAAKAALDRSSSRRILVSHLYCLWDYYVGHPSKKLPKRLR